MEPEQIAELMNNDTVRESYLAVYRQAAINNEIVKRDDNFILLQMKNDQRIPDRDRVHILKLLYNYVRNTRIKQQEIETQLENEYRRLAAALEKEANLNRRKAEFSGLDLSKYSQEELDAMGKLLQVMVGSK